LREIARLPIRRNTRTGWFHTKIEKSEMLISSFLAGKEKRETKASGIYKFIWVYETTLLQHKSGKELGTLDLMYLSTKG